VHASPRVVVFESMCDAAGRSTWQPEQAEEIAGLGFTGPCGSTTAFSPRGRFCSLPLTWHKEQFLVSVGSPVGLSAGNSVLEKSLWLPPNPTTIYVRLDACIFMP